MPRLMIVTDAQLAICAATLLKRNSVVIPTERLREIVQGEPKLVLNLKGYFDHATDLDTYDRGYLGFAVAKSIGFDDWPCNGDSDDHARRFYLALVDAGYVPSMTSADVEKLRTKVSP